MLRIFFMTMLVILSCGAGASLRGAPVGRHRPAADPEPGVARSLARWRAAHYRNVRYALSVVIAPGAELLTGELEIRVTSDDAAHDLVLDWRVMKREGGPAARVSEIVVNGRAAGADARRVNDHIVIPRAYLVKGENHLRLNFASPISATGSAAVTRYVDREDNAEYIYTLFVPSDASTAFPCFDQPDLKARFRLTVTAPAKWTIIANTQGEEKIIAECAADQPCEPRQTQKFRETEPISTYVFAFAAGEFAAFADEASPLGTRLFVRKSKAERARRELAEVFRLNRTGTEFFARYFAYKFPFPKYDLVVIPEFPFRGMEHAGATFLREESILFPSEPTANDLLTRAELMFHEAAHQWFGDLVTMRWFDDLWLKEGFATFMAIKAVEATMPQYDAWKAFYQRTKPAAYETDATKGTTPIWQEIANLSAAKSAYGNIVYRKAPAMLRQAEFYLGAPQFQRAVRLFLKEHAFANAEWDDLVGAFERTSGRRLDAWANAWVKRRGMADVRVEWSADDRGRITRLTLRQQDVLGEGGAWPMRLRLLLADASGGGGRKSGRGARAKGETIEVTLDGGGGATRIREALGRPRPDFVFANYEDYGYGRFLLDEKSRASVLKNLGAVRDDFLRALLWGSLWESVREAELAPADYLELGIRLVARERDEVTAQAILGRLQTAFNRYLSDEQRREIAPHLEEMVFDGMMRAPTLGLRITYFRAFQTIAATPAARDRLKGLLTGEIKVPGLQLRSRDRFDIITVLLARTADGGEAPEALALLEKQRREDQSDDGRRYAYAAGAARRTGDVKKSYFDAYLNDPQLPESWIEASVNPLNTISHAELTLPLLEPALGELPKLKRARKIFFVNSWLAAFIGGQCSERALGVVQNHLQREQTLDRDLRLKVLEAADGLERCVRIRATYTSGKT